MRVIPLALVALLGLAPLAQAQQQPYGPNPDSKSLRQHYVEGRLDIARVIYKTDLWSACGIVPARLVYELFPLAQLAFAINDAPMRPPLALAALGAGLAYLGGGSVFG